jgi:hypothetical protein
MRPSVRLHEPAKAGDRSLAPGEALFSRAWGKDRGVLACEAGDRDIVASLCRQLRKLASLESSNPRLG